jgi:predicted RNA-binding Zn ribbon-like protein
MIPAVDRDDLITGREQSGGREPADDDLRLVQDFVNTVDRENGVELFDGPDGLRDWLAYRHLPGADDELSSADLRRALEVREALRALLLANNGEPEDPSAYGTLDAAARRARLHAAFAGPALEPDAHGVDASIGHVLATAFAAILDGRWARLKACPREVCGWVFHDRSTANRGTWCSMRVCGNRVKANAYYRRRTQPSSSGPRTSSGSMSSRKPL